MTSSAVSPKQNWSLPPLILHPFSRGADPKRLEAAARASLIRKGLLPDEGVSHEELERKLLSGRYCELSMLFHIGKDVKRWIEQCHEFVNSQPALHEAGVGAGSIAALLVDNPPPNITRKCENWGVHDPQRIFSRALGLQAIFSALPEFEVLSPDFIRNYHRYADQMFVCWQRLESCSPADPDTFRFELYTSNEYSKLLEAEWGLSDPAPSAE